MANLISQDSVPYQERLGQNMEDGLYLKMDDSCFSPKVDSLPKMHNSASSKRKMVEKRVIRVRAEGNDELQRTNRPPSDPWSWRKYGQKPIKGSPYPRGYYKCSTCKGCSAKKRVERCRNDASTLIITYTSTHNHPPTEALKQQEALTNTVNRPQSTATNPLLPPPTSPTTMTRRLLDKSSFSIQQGNNHGGSSPPPVGQHSEKEEELSPSSTLLSSPSLPLDGNDFFNELEELIPISPSSALDGSTFLL